MTWAVPSVEWIPVHRDGLEVVVLTQALCLLIGGEQRLLVGDAEVGERGRVILQIFWAQRPVALQRLLVDAA